MTRHGFVRIAAAGCALLTLGTAAYACCYYHLTWGENAPCDGEITEVCEWSSPGCASATDLSCMRTIGSRHGKCYKYILTTGDAWGRFACDAHPGPGWKLVGRNPDGSCCWIKGYPIKSETELPFYLNICDTQCDPSEQ
jgi:hypothetical protein